MVVFILISGEYPVMNLSHAAAILFYELSGSESGATEMASRQSLNLLQEGANSLLLDVCYPQHKADFADLMLRRIFGRAELTEREARSLLGIIKRIRWRITHGQETGMGADDNA